MVVERRLHSRLEKGCRQHDEDLGDNANYVYQGHNDDLDVLWKRFGNLSCGRGWEDEDVSGGGVLRGGQGAGCRVPSKPLVRRELLVHHT